MTDTTNPTVLVVCSGEDGDEELLATAADLAQDWDADVAVLAALEPPSEIGRIAHAAGVSADDIAGRLAADCRDKVAGLVARTAPDLRATIDVRLGKPFIEIIRQVIARDVDLVLKTAEELTGIHHHLFASTDQHLLRKCPCPVWLRWRGSPRSVKTVLAAVDVDEATVSEPETLAGLNRRILETAARIGAGAGAGAAVHVLHVWDAPGEGLVRLWSDASDPDQAVQAYVDEARSVHWQSLDRLVEQARGWIGPELAERIKLAPLLERGTARAVIPQQAQALKADVLVMGTIARTGVPGFIIGNTAEDVLNSVDCSVVTVKPPDYVSPVKTEHRP